ERQRVLQQGLADALPPGRRLDQDEGHPGDPAEEAGRRRAPRGAVHQGDEAAVGLKVERAPPVGFRLVPACLPAQPQAKGQGDGGHGTNVGHREKGKRKRPATRDGLKRVLCLGQEKEKSVPPGSLRRRPSPKKLRRRDEGIVWEWAEEKQVLF